MYGFLSIAYVHRSATGDKRFEACSTSPLGNGKEIWSKRKGGSSFYTQRRRCLMTSCEIFQEVGTPGSINFAEMITEFHENRRDHPSNMRDLLLAFRAFVHWEWIQVRTKSFSPWGPRFHRQSRLANSSLPDRTP